MKKIGLIAGGLLCSKNTWFFLLLEVYKMSRDDKPIESKTNPLETVVNMNGCSFKASLDFKSKYSIITKTICRQIGGKINYTNDENKGSTNLVGTTNVLLNIDEAKINLDVRIISTKKDLIIIGQDFICHKTVKLLFEEGKFFFSHQSDVAKSNVSNEYSDY